MNTSLIVSLLLFLLFGLGVPRPLKKEEPLKLFWPFSPSISKLLPDRVDLECKFSTVYNRNCFSKRSEGFSGLVQPMLELNQLPFVFYYNEFPGKLEPEELNYEIKTKFSHQGTMKNIKAYHRDFKEDIKLDNLKNKRTLESKIPKILNFVWLMNPEDPKPLSTDQKNNIGRPAFYLDDEWTIRVWVNDVELAAPLVSNISQRVEVKDVSEIKMIPSLKKKLNELVSFGYMDYPTAVYSIFLLILEGGVFNSLDVSLWVPMSYYLQNYSSILIAEKNKYSLDFFSAPPQAGVLKSILAKVLHSESLSKKYGQIIDDLGQWNTLRMLWTAFWVNEYVSNDDKGIQDIMVLTSNLGEWVLKNSGDQSKSEALESIDVDLFKELVWLHHSKPRK